MLEDSDPSSTYLFELAEVDDGLLFGKQRDKRPLRIALIWGVSLSNLCSAGNAWRDVNQLRVLRSLTRPELRLLMLT
jgi:hypothetical protein